MPSLEIICLGQCEPTDFSYLPCAVEAETTLHSHRDYPSLFQPDFDQLQGCMYHLGGSCLRFPGVWQRYAYTAANLCTEWWEFLEFKPRYKLAVQILLKTLLAASPEEKLLFTSDYQFGPSKVRRYKRPITLEQFWQRHDEKRLWVNASFSIIRGGKIQR
ncbi:hypothetical protein [Armatimonas sp.]|uniref:hypothetical protein n=1 Tax=Armatimonas sp. TaxID=1872638 RepID=UPI00286A01D7|nr:hypothetical protein [Armatimonas sp.]